MLPPFGWSAVVTQWQFAPVVTVLVALFAAPVPVGRRPGGAAASGPAVAAVADRACSWAAWRSS